MAKFMAPLSSNCTLWFSLRFTGQAMFSFDQLLRGASDQWVLKLLAEQETTAMESYPKFSPFCTFLLHDPALNKGTAFTREERDKLGLRGLLPPRVHSQEEQMGLALANVRKKSSDLERYIFMIGLQDRNETLFYRTVLDHLEEMMPIIYTPTVGLACQQYGHIFRRPRGIFISIKDTGRVRRILENWPTRNVQVIVVTDGERVLGLGDLGADGMGVPVGKLALYTACAGFHPSACLPVTIDVGTDNEELLKDPLYIGIQQGRVRGTAYQKLMDEFLTAVREVFRHALVQFEGLGDSNAFDLLNKYQHSVCIFNDDIQSVAAVTLAGLYSALRLIKRSLVDQRFLLVGTGQAERGIANLLVEAMTREGSTEAGARARCWFFDSKGLLVSDRTDLAEYERAFAHDHEPIADLASTINSLRPTALIGASGPPLGFSVHVLNLMGNINERPIIFALSTPTWRSECTAAQAYHVTDGRAIFASGNPFDDVLMQGRRFISSQSISAYISPGVGLGIAISRSRLLPSETFLIAAQTLADKLSGADYAEGRVYPPLCRIREISLAIATQVAEFVYDRGLADGPRPKDVEAYIRTQMYEPDYRDYVNP
jgi:malate dehydrogenase (oxaloacetate-decarboxylating)(NADP+)